MPLEVWKLNRQVQSVAASMTLRVLAPRPFRLKWSFDGWANSTEAAGAGTSIGMWFHDLDPGNAKGNDVRFVFRWEDTDQWDTTDYRVAISP